MGRPGRLLAPTAALLIVLAACGSAKQGTVEGLLTAVDGDLVTVRSFTMLTDDGPQTYLPAEDGEYPFPLPHLGEHLRTGEPVVVFWEDRDGVRYAVRIDDAEPGGH